MYKITAAVIVAAFALFAFAPAQAVPLTGVPTGGSTWPAGSPYFGSPNSTNADNYNATAPGISGQGPYVLFQSNGPGQVTLLFDNPVGYIEYFEYRIDGITPPGLPANPITGDGEYPGYGLTGSSASHTLFANSMVEVRLSLGAENHWDFDWTAFAVQPTPLPAALPLFASGLGAIGLLGWRRKRKKAALAA
jgi:hypothetical protein